MRISRFLPVVVFARVAVVVTAFSLTACTGKAASAGVSPPVAPVTVDLSTPQASVRTYLQFTSFAYRMAFFARSPISPAPLPLAALFRCCTSARNHSSCWVGLSRSVLAR